MKRVNVSYFRPSGKWYTEETIEISGDMSGYEALFEKIPKLHRIKGMFMLVQDSGDEKEPYIVPHLFHPIEQNK